MNQNLEDAVRGIKKPILKSDGERRIAYFLDSNSIKYHYEPGVLVNLSGNKQRIWYPDFYLPEFKTYIEYYGLAGNQNYDLGIKTKKTVYLKMGMDVIPVYPWMLNKNWQGYVMKELKTATTRRYRNIMAKTYRSKFRPTLNNKIHPAWGGYRRGTPKNY